ncbi:glutamine--fructose-6-phosphate transaminase (isomerizing) [Candidatus Dependentiae bacterium]
MCSVVGYIGKSYSREFVLKGLERLEYRGYDSAGFACLHPEHKQILYAKAQGALSNLTEKIEKYPIDGFVGIGHTRWATHGQASENNAHPHFDCEKKISVVHNGIIENHHVLKQELIKTGHVFHSDTDSEIIAHLLESLIASCGDIKLSVIKLVERLEGAFAFLAILQDNPDFMIIVRKRSPLCVGVGQDQMFVASDIQAFASKTNKIIFLPDESFAFVSKDMVELYNFSGKAIPIKIQEIDLDVAATCKQGHAHFMVKEIYEQKSAIYSTLEFLKSINSKSSNIWEQMGLSEEKAKNLQNIAIVGCGTSWHAARIAQFFFEEICMIPTKVFLASEFRYMHFFPDENSLYVAVSQSGETADTLEALQMINSLNLPTVALTNVASSSMVREAGGFLLTQAGPEVAVASTKAFSTQLTAFFWLAHRLALEKGIIDQNKMELAQEDILVAAEVLENSIENYKLEIVQDLSKKYAKYSKAIFLGRHISYPFALEAALKLKEISYIFSQAYPAGELKHGPLALVDKETPVFVFSHQDPLIYKKLVSNAIEAKSRHGHIVAFAFTGQDELLKIADKAFVFPKVHPLLGPLAMTGLMQFLPYCIAKELKCDIDKPRNLAKSVTVE